MLPPIIYIRAQGRQQAQAPTAVANQTMTRRRERAKAQHTMNNQLQPSYWQSAEAQKKEKDSSGNIYLKMSDVVFEKKNN